LKRTIRAVKDEAQEAAERLEVDVREGLTSAEAARRLERAQRSASRLIRPPAAPTPPSPPA
jgi:hypothetical protein